MSVTAEAARRVPREVRTSAAEPARPLQELWGVQALSDVDLEVPPADHRTGRDNGAASHVDQVIAGIWTPSAGQIYWDGNPVSIRTPKEADQLGIATSTRTSHCATTSTSCRTCSSATRPFAPAARRDPDGADRQEDLADLSVTTVNSVRQAVGSSPVASANRWRWPAVMRDARLVIMDEPLPPSACPRRPRSSSSSRRWGQGHHGHRHLAQPQRRLHRRRPTGRPLSGADGQQRPDRRLRRTTRRRAHHHGRLSGAVASSSGSSTTRRLSRWHSRGTHIR